MYEKSVFNRGLLITSVPAKEIERKLFGKKFFENIQGWGKTYFGPYSVWVSPNLNYETVRDKTYGVAVAGLCLNPFDGSNDNKIIAEKLYESLKKGLPEFLNYVDQLSGSFIILSRINEVVSCIQDAAATKPFFFYKDFGGLISACTHSKILAEIHGLDTSAEAKTTLADQEYKRDPSRYLPGNITPFSKLNPLYANNQLVLNTAISHRFFPREILKSNEDLEFLAKKAASLMVNQAKLIHERKRPIYIALTAGRDSRVSASSFYGLDNTTYFTFHNARTGHLTQDVITAQHLSRLSKVDLKIFDLENYKDKKFNSSFVTHSPMGIWESAALCYLTELPENSIHIRSTVSEIGRNFYKNRLNKDITPINLASIYTKTGFSSSSTAIAAMTDFITGANFNSEAFFNYEMHDLFYWEHRNSKWQNTLCQEAEMATDVFIPFNNRELIKLLLKAPSPARISAKIHERIPELLAKPFIGVPYAS